MLYEIDSTYNDSQLKKTTYYITKYIRQLLCFFPVELLKKKKEPIALFGIKDNNKNNLFDQSR